jgi:AraC-like DNA-binding protein
MAFPLFDPAWLVAIICGNHLPLAWTLRALFVLFDSVDAYDPLAWPPRVPLANHYPFRAGETSGPHWSESDLYLPVLSGRGTISVGPRSFALEPGQLLHVPWAAPVRYVPDVREPFAVIGVHLAYRRWQEPVVTHPLHTSTKVTLERGSMQQPPTPVPWREPFVMTPPPDARAFDLAAAIARAFEELDAPDREARLRALALEFILDLRALRAGAQRDGAHPRAAAVRALSSWMELQVARPRVSRAELAQRAGMSESALAAAFNAVLGRSPIDHLIELRLARARRLLASGNDPVARVGEQVGIPDQFYFSKLFKRRHGVSPLAYRRRRRL